MTKAFFVYVYPDQHDFHDMDADAAVLFGPEVGLLDGVRLPEDAGRHLIITLKHRGPGAIWPDYWPLSGDILVSSKWMKFVSRQSDRPNTYQFLEPTYAPDSVVPKEMGYKLLNLLDHVDCLDLEHSRYKLEEDGEKTFYEHVLRHDAVDGLQHMFRIKDDRTMVAVSRQLAEVLQNSGLTGMYFQEVDLSYKPDNPAYGRWIEERKRKNEEHRIQMAERQDRLLLRKPDGTKYQTGDNYPVKRPEEGPFKEEPPTRPIPE